MNRLPLALVLVSLPALSSSARAGGAGEELFEAKIRPVLVESCYGCHNSEKKAEGGLALDYRDGLRGGGASGPAVVPGKPAESLLLKAIRHADAKLRMPKGEAKLSGAVVNDFTRWVALGAPDPRDEPPTASQLQALTSWESVRERRKAWWSFQPIKDHKPPDVRRKGWSDHPVDRFVLARMEEAGLGPSGPADRPTLIRRVAFAITGLPPTPEEIERFVNDESKNAYEDLVDRLLSSPRFGERWARHWMDWVRYADSHGSEGDPSIPHAWRYRDYLIRALNADVPYDRLVREQLAGDLMDDPRVNKELGLNESAVGVAQLRMVPHGYAPTDAAGEQVTFTDNQIDVVTKAFLGLTVSCARCHDHKFDPIAQSDFYALYGVMASARPALVTVDAPGRLLKNRDELLRLKAEIRQKLAEAWIRSLSGSKAAKTETPDAPARPAPGVRLRWDLTGKDYDGWFKHGDGLPERPSAPGEFRVDPAGDAVVPNVYPAGVYTHLVSDKNNGVLMSPRFKVETDAVSVRVAGGGGARVRVVVQNYPRVEGLIYKAFEPSGEGMTWFRWDTRYWKGEWAYVEIATGEDLPVEVKPNGGRSWFGISEVVCHDEGWKPPAPGKQDAGSLGEAVAAWARGKADDGQAEVLSAALRGKTLPNTLAALPDVAPLVAEYRRLEAEVPAPTRSPGVLEGTAFDQPMFLRGDPKKQGEAVPRRFLEVFDSKPYATAQSGRKELAGDLVGPKNPLAPRVAVNRIWHHLFGRGIVATPDNFGRLGELPSHPELLDAMAATFVAEGWSVKKTIRRIVTSKTYQMSSHPSKLAAERDPADALLSHFPVRRLDAEAVRDAILAVSGRLDETRYGVNVRGRSRRRSVYVRVQRTDLDPFLNAFDAPEPLTTRGRRDTTNVPAQSLTLLNDPWVVEQSLHWAEDVARGPGGDDAKIDRMFVTALGRPPTADELSRCRQFLADSERERDRGRRESARLDAEIATRRGRLDALTSPVRERLASRKSKPVRSTHAPTPVARWEFDGDLRDSLGALHGEAVGKARVEGGALILDGQSYVKTAPLIRPLGAKTLEARVVLDDLGQRGGGVISAETRGGGVFDAIVFGEQEPGAWMAGSDFFRRTQSFDGPAESQAERRPVRLAIVYQADGTILGYRDGKPYGRPYKSAGPVTFEAGASHVLFGLRHSPEGGGKLLKGKILDARLYDRALGPDEVAAAAGATDDPVSDADVLAALPAGQRDESERLTREVAALAEERRAHKTREAEPTDGAAGRWQGLAHAIMNFKEFIYIR